MSLCFINLFRSPLNRVVQKRVSFHSPITEVKPFFPLTMLREST